MSGLCDGEVLFMMLKRRDKSQSYSFEQYTEMNYQANNR
jgi:hypothetical protein